jgi:hypothetical protein
LLAKFCSQAVGEGFITVCDNPETCTRLRHIAKRETVRVRDRKDAIVSFQRL